jgi:hypothetical protein
VVQHGVEIGGPLGDEPLFNEDGVDLTLIRWMLSLSPDERLDVLQGFLNSVAEIRGAQDGAQAT